MTTTTTTGTSETAIEWAPFRLAPGTTEEDLLAAAEALQRSFLDRQPGFLRRHLLRGADGRWVDLLFWASEADARKAMEAFAAEPACSRYLALMVLPGGDDPDAGVQHFRAAASYGPA